MKFLSLILFLVFSANAQRTTEQRCPKMAGGQYLIGDRSTSAKIPQSVILQISLKKKNFNREFMLSLVKRLRADFCTAPVISVTIYDDPKLAKDPANLFILLESHQKVILMRGFYNLNRSTGEEGIEFSTALGHPTNEVEIKLTNGEPISGP
jgi:hypothetical protein